MSVNIPLLKKMFFYFDEPVPYQLSAKTKILIYPILVKDSEIFLACKDILEIDKNSIADVNIIQMSYLQFLAENVLQQEENVYKFLKILSLCLNINHPVFLKDLKFKILLKDTGSDVIITPQQFDDIKRIILYQNLINYDDEYINPELNKKLQEEIYLKNKNIEMPTLERQMAIISAHSGILKKDQLNMSFRSFTCLFNEIYEESEYSTNYPFSMLFGGKNKPEQWIYKVKKNKFADRVISVTEFNKQAGGDGNVMQKQS